MEVAYKFDHYGQGVLLALLPGSGWLFGTSVAALWCDWRLSARGNRHGLKVAFLIYALGAALLCAGAYLVLPAEAVTQLIDAAAPARLAYQKDLIYHLVVIFCFCLPTFHFILAMQRELLAGQHENMLGLLTGNRLAVPPRGVAYPRFWLLIAIALVFFLYGIYAHHNLMSKLQPGAYKWLFALLVQVRLMLFYTLMIKGLWWYSGLLNDLKRECLLVERINLTT